MSVSAITVLISDSLSIFLATKNKILETIKPLSEIGWYPVAKEASPNWWWVCGLVLIYKIRGKDYSRESVWGVLSTFYSMPNRFIYFVIQTNRIARILAGSKKKICTKKPRFMSACAQLVIAFLLILLQLGIIVALLIIEPPQVCVFVNLTSFL